MIGRIARQGKLPVEQLLSGIKSIPNMTPHCCIKHTISPASAVLPAIGFVFLPPNNYIAVMKSLMRRLRESLNKERRSFFFKCVFLV